MIGKPIRMDQAMTKKDKMSFARILVEVPIDDSLPEVLGFVNKLT